MFASICDYHSNSCIVLNCPPFQILEEKSITECTILECGNTIKSLRSGHYMVYTLLTFMHLLAFPFSLSLHILFSVCIDVKVFKFTFQLFIQLYLIFSCASS